MRRSAEMVEVLVPCTVKLPDSLKWPRSPKAAPLPAKVPPVAPVAPKLTLPIKALPEVDQAASSVPPPEIATSVPEGRALGVLSLSVPLLTVVPPP